ncbi:MATE family efflux transporter [Senegalia sp. (in: firmicutes)]|uniref:MATE family efflux transporter n=1 Tax=Senegalia sp. (in: firmicutes) TaxID=1924098 RepID=UPI003F95C808
MSRKSISKRELLINNENLYFNVIYLAWPIILQSLLQVLIGTIDIKMVGSLGVDAISAVGTGRNIIMLIMILVMAISTGTVAMISRFTGMEDHKGVSVTAGQAFFLSIVAAAFMIPTGLLTNEWILNILGVHDNVLILAKEYMSIFFISIPFFLLNFMAKSIFQGAGDTKTPLIIDIVMNAMNVLGNFIFIFGFWIFPAMGVSGAAMGTLVARLIGSILGWGALVSGKFVVKVDIMDMIRPKWEIGKQIISIGLPTAFQGLSRNISRFIIFAILARTITAEAAVPAYVIGTNLNQYALMPGLAVGTAAATLSGMNIGAKKFERAYKMGKICALLGAILMGVLAFIFAVFSTPLIKFFLNESNPEVLQIGKTFLIIIGLSEPLHAVTITLSRTMQGAGYTKYPFLITLVSWIFIRISLSYILAISFNLGPTGVWIGIAVSTVISGLLSYLLFKKKDWQCVKIKDTNN